MLRHLDVAHDRFGLSTPFRISRGVKTAADVVTVTVRQGEAVGRGEAVPYARYGETIDGTLATIHAIGPHIAAGASRADVARLLPAGAARNAVDCALWDLEARLAGTSVAALAGIAEAVALPSAITIGLDHPDAMARAAAKVAHVPLLKIKVDRTDPAIASCRALSSRAAVHSRSRACYRLPLLPSWSIRPSARPPRARSSDRSGIGPRRTG